MLCIVIYRHRKLGIHRTKRCEREREERERWGTRLSDVPYCMHIYKYVCMYVCKHVQANGCSSIILLRLEYSRDGPRAHEQVGISCQPGADQALSEAIKEKEGGERKKERKKKKIMFQTGSESRKSR